MEMNSFPQNTMKRARTNGFGAAKRRRRKGPYKGRIAIGELKFHDLDIDDATIAQGGNIAQASCNIIAQGTTESQRVGRKCTIKSINWRMQIKLIASTATAATSDSIRVILYLDKQTNGATAAVTDIFETADFQSFNNLANKSRFRTLMDRTYDMVCKCGSGRGSTDTLAFGEDVINDTFFKKCNIDIEYDNSATGGELTTQRTNNIGVLLLASSGSTQFGSKMRLRFADA